MCKAWQLIFSCFSLCALVKRCLIDKNMKKKDLRLATGMSTTALAKLGKNQHVSTEILTKICEVLDCDFCDIIELVKEENHD